MLKEMPAQEGSQEYGEAGIPVLISNPLGPDFLECLPGGRCWALVKRIGQHQWLTT